ncbi:MAG: hypothetical protein KAX81_00395 [Leadbetterella sp.]|nr:hypothetical protein [Leadbetterella sp.]
MRNIVIFATFLFFIFSCKSTKIASSWKEPGKQVDLKNLNKILVVAMLKNENSRHQAESEMVEFLDGKGVASYDYLKVNFNKSNEEALRDKIKKDGFDGAITMRLLDVERERNYTLSYIGPNGWNPISFPNYYYRSWPNNQENGYYLTTKTFVVEIAIFSIIEDKIIWTSETRTINPEGVDKMTKEISKVLYKRMVKEGFLAK